MALDEYLFGLVANYFKKEKKLADKALGKTVYLEKSKSRLTLLASALTGEKIEIFPSEREGGYKNRNFFLPVSFSLLPTFADNYAYYLFRVLYLHTQRSLELNWNDSGVRQLAASQQMAFDTSPQVLASLFTSFPACQGLYDNLVSLFAEVYGSDKIDYSWLYGKWMNNEAEQPNDKKLSEIAEIVRKSMQAAPTTTLKARAVEDVKSITVDKIQQENYVLTHNFEKVETADEFNGVWRDFDGDDDLESHSNALDELNMKFTVRVDDPVHSVYQAEFVENATVLESTEVKGNNQCFVYSEWDFTKRKYRNDFCSVFPIAQQTADNSYYKSTIAENARLLQNLRKTMASVNNKMQQQRRQTQGDAFDFDAVTDAFAEMLSKRTTTDKLYLSNRKKDKDISILLLLDISLSSDGYVDGLRVIDVEKQVSILFGEILNEYAIDFAVKGFFSKTRNYSSYVSIKDFDENWSVATKRIGGLEPQGYTRIGAALRHSGALLKSRNSKNKWVILISDGKPNDYDKYEGAYGINDVKQALRELNESKIQSYALAIESTAKYYLPQMFGTNHYQIVSKPYDLIYSMLKLYERIKQ